MKRFAALMIAFAALGCDGCDSCGKEQTAAPDAAVEPPVPAPAGVLAEAVLATPDATWGRLQRGVGGFLAILAPTIGGLASSVAGADPSLGSEIDGTAPAYGVIAGTPPSLVLCMHARNAGRAKEILAGDAGRFRAAGETGSLSMFEPTSSGYAIGVAPGWIVVGKTKDDLEKLGPYAYRTLPTRPLPRANLHVDFMHDAFAGWLAPWAAAKWSGAKAFLVAKDDEMRQSHGGREPDFGDAHVIVELLDGVLKTRTDAIGDVASGMFDVDVREDAITGSLDLVPGGGASKTLMDAMKPGPVKLGRVPRDTLGVLVFHEDLAERKDSAKAISDGIVRVMGKRLPAADAKQLATSLDAWASARGDWLGLGLGRSGAVMNAPAADKATEATKDLCAVFEKPALKGPVGPAGWAVKDGLIQLALPAPVLATSTDDRFETALAKVESSFAFAAHLNEIDPISTLAATRKDGKIDIAIDAAPVLVRDIIKIMTSM